VHLAAAQSATNVATAATPIKLRAHCRARIKVFSILDCT